MSINIDILTQLEKIIEDNNAIGGSLDISESLNHRVKAVFKGVDGMHENLPVLNTQLPCVFIEAVDKEEDWGQFGGGSNRRQMNLNYRLVPITSYGMGSSTNGESRENASAELLQLADNLERLIRNNATLSNTVMSCRCKGTTYKSMANDSTYSCSARIELEIKRYGE